MPHPSQTDPAAHPDNRIGAEPPRTRAWQDGKVVAEGFPVVELSEHLRRGEVVWVDVCAPAEHELRVLAGELNLDPVAVEDAVSPRERAKLDRYHDYFFLNLYVPHVDDGALSLHEISAFVTERAVVTIRQDRALGIDALIERWDDGPELDRPELAGNTVAVLLYGLLDLVVDRQLDAAQAFDDEADELEGLLFDENASLRGVQQRSFRFRKDLARLRRITLPMREVLNTLLRRDMGFVPQALIPYYQDVYDHTLRASEWTDSLRELITNVMDSRIAMQGNQLNEVMKKVTSWAAVIAVPTAVTGFYGQNVPYPGHDTHWGFLVSTTIIALCSVGLYVAFKKRNWL
ncbi:magnesium transporter CorA family protein [Actinomadura macrotermitis]|uniref:Cobalt/magnesium transport protein CorA n=1 Tax=Actinomadura macrotermitis TaxID=2585200 RepID=A0A7K0BS64_9ACTN|nr:magnesium transporter CorA family protein [Actinomadura macrotermitis]MQY04045.1 Cobalt/magnesium transport protein CorA [Actinomadura macrotermitis]